MAFQRALDRDAIAKVVYNGAARANYTNLTPATWKWLHMLVYFAWALLVLHVALGALRAERSIVYRAMLIGAAVVVAGLHLVAGRTAADLCGEVRHRRDRLVVDRHRPPLPGRGRRRHRYRRRRRGRRGPGRSRRRGCPRWSGSSRRSPPPRPAARRPARTRGWRGPRSSCPRDSRCAGAARSANSRARPRTPRARAAARRRGRGGRDPPTRSRRQSRAASSPAPRARCAPPRRPTRPAAPPPTAGDDTALHELIERLFLRAREVVALEQVDAVAAEQRVLAGAADRLVVEPVDVAVGLLPLGHRRSAEGVRVRRQAVPFRAPAGPCRRPLHRSGDGRVYRNVTVADLRDGYATRVTDYWGEPFEAPAWRESLADALDMPPRGVWPAAEVLQDDDESR